MSLLPYPPPSDSSPILVRHARLSSSFVIFVSHLRLSSSPPILVSHHVVVVICKWLGHIRCRLRRGRSRLREQGMSARVLRQTGVAHRLKSKTNDMKNTVALSVQSCAHDLLPRQGGNKARRVAGRRLRTMLALWIGMEVRALRLSCLLSLCHLLSFSL